MKPVDQTIMHEPHLGLYGDCMRAALASMLEVPIEKVPHFLHDNTSDNAEFCRRVSDFLRPLNLGYISFPECRQALHETGVRGLVHEVSGTSERGVCHACVAVDGEIVHDPHPGRGGLDKIDYFGVFIVLDPSKPIGRPA